MFRFLAHYHPYWISHSTCQNRARPVDGWHRHARCVNHRFDGKPLLPTRESITRTDLYLYRISGAVTVNRTDDCVRNHKLPGAIRAAKIQLRDEKIFTGT